MGRTCALVINNTRAKHTLISLFVLKDAFDFAHWYYFIIKQITVIDTREIFCVRIVKIQLILSLIG